MICTYILLTQNTDKSHNCTKIHRNKTNTKTPIPSRQVTLLFNMNLEITAHFPISVRKISDIGILCAEKGKFVAKYRQ